MATIENPDKFIDENLKDSSGYTSIFPPHYVVKELNFIKRENIESSQRKASRSYYSFWTKMKKRKDFKKITK